MPRARPAPPPLCGQAEIISAGRGRAASTSPACSSRSAASAAFMPSSSKAAASPCRASWSSGLLDPPADRHRAGHHRLGSPGPAIAGSARPERLPAPDLPSPPMGEDVLWDLDLHGARRAARVLSTVAPAGPHARPAARIGLRRSTTRSPSQAAGARHRPGNAAASAGDAGDELALQRPIARAQTPRTGAPAHRESGSAQAPGRPAPPQSARGPDRSPCRSTGAG